MCKKNKHTHFDIAFDECATAPCGNHTCVNGMGTFTCVCSGGWSGARCEMPPDFCLNHDCKHGICVPGSEKYACNCTDFYTSVDCSIPPGMHTAP
ncbi:hypothetical protein DPMN_095173 [Dreissena polymorpha]|uniref:EGF-like domain-containing protein n=1 Tax=Dreissena polymorpha TaxID=45954 RepID=A0A9D4R477_DREPO|nr:hypothetical protein DPMN_095173 [Dreissena polymorpha]